MDRVSGREEISTSPTRNAPSRILRGVTKSQLSHCGVYVRIAVTPALNEIYINFGELITVR